MKTLMLATCLLFSLNSPCPADTKDTYENKCSKCHGKSGQGDGRKGRDLDPMPTDFSNPKVFTDKKKDGLEPDARLAKAIREGGPAVGQSKGMDAFPDFSEQEVKDLVEFIKTFQKK